MEKNTSYFFIPFSYKRKFHEIIGKINSDQNWELFEDKINYMFKYVADKLDSNNENECRCYHFLLKKEARDRLYIAGLNSEFELLENHPEKGKIRFAFTLQKVHLYCFATGIGILAFQISYRNADPYYIANAQYYMKKISRTKIHTNQGSMVSGRDDILTLLKLAEYILSDIKNEFKCEFFFYSNEERERSNILTYIEVPSMENTQQKLFFLKRSVGDTFQYIENKEQEKRETYVHSEKVEWGFSPESAACLVLHRQDAENHFVDKVFYRNFHSQYLFMYVLLLHQKYVLYLFLTQIGIGEYTDHRSLEQYKNDLYEFETNYVFSCITEVPQYQELYNKMYEVFALREMYEDVREPLQSLAEIRRENVEKQLKENDEQINKALILLSFFSVFSAFVDSFDFIQSFFETFFGNRVDDIVIKSVQLGCTVLIFATFIYVIYKLRVIDRRKKKTEQKNEGNKHCRC